jgi:hypothetical protein
MKRTFIFVGIVIVALSALVFSYTQMSAERVAEAQADRPVTAVSVVTRNISGQTVVSLDTNAQQIAGLQTAVLAATRERPEVKGFGRVVDLATLTASVADLESARAAASVSGREYKRLQSLSAQDNVAERTLEAAGATATRDRTASEATLAKFKLDWGEKLAEDGSKILSQIADGKTQLVQIELPAGETLSSPPVAARIAALNDETHPVTADFLDMTDGVNPQTQAQSAFLRLAGRPLTPGAAVTGYLEIPGESTTGVVVPEAAVIRADGRSWIYTQTSETSFTRCEISTRQPVTGGWLVTNGVTPGDRVVIIGAQVLLSEERKSQIQMGD